MTISEISPFLRDLFRPSRADLEELRNRGDDRLSQVIRNLVSHRTLERRGLATFQRGNDRSPGYYVLTDRGWHEAISLLDGKNVEITSN